MSEDIHSVVSNEPANGKKKSKGIWATILIPALLFSIFDVIGEKLAETTVDSISENRAISQIEQFSELAKKYVPGTLTEDSYSSEYWNLEFQADGPWVMADEADREELSRELSASAKASAAQAVQGEDINQELREAFMDSFYGATEMYALYLDEEGYCMGEANLSVMQVYGLNQTTEAEFFQGVADRLSRQFENVTISEVTIGGKIYGVITFSTEQNGMTLHIKSIYLTKDVTSCYLRITYVDGYEEIYNSFLEHLSTYN